MTQSYARHICLQPPQLNASVAKFLQAVPQRFSPPVQVLVQVELLQVAAPVPAVMEQAVPQLPQLLASLVRSLHEAPQLVNPELHVPAAHVPLEHAVVPLGTAVQALPHAPQLARLV